MSLIFKLLPIFSAFLATVMAILAMNPVARRMGWVDKPDNLRKLHGCAIPLTGGVAMMLAFVATILWFDNTHLRLMGAMLIMSLVGFWDDRSHLSARFRLLLQGIVGLLLALTADLSMSNLGNLMGGGPVLLHNYLGIFFTVFCVMGAMNAINMIDGVDGLAGGVVLSALMWMAFLTSLANIPETTVLLCLIGCVSGYLCFNMRGPLRTRASVFMGDAGSMMLGVALAWLLINLSQADKLRDDPVIAPVVGLWLVAVPLLDTISLMISRGIDGKSPMKADRDHFHHILQDAGLSDTETTVTIVLIAAILGGIGAISWKLGVPESVLFFAFLALACAYYYFIHHTEKLAGFVSCARKGRLLCDEQKQERLKTSVFRRPDR